MVELRVFSCTNLNSVKHSRWYNQETVKSKLYEAAMYDLNIVSRAELPPAAKTTTQLPDLATSIRSLIGTASTIKQLASRIMSTFYFSVYHHLRDAYHDSNISGAERHVRGISV